MTEPDRDRRIDELSERIANLEAALRQVTRPYIELVDQLGQFQRIVQKYFRLLDLYQRHGIIAIDVILPQLRDPISKEIMRILLERPGQNISQVAEELRVRTGSSSRRIVRGRLDELVKEGLIVEERGKKSSSFRVSETVIKKWTEVIGLTK
ncbi:MAG: ArsR family transcriptional regulator [Euryarchaeota archaeon]|nr:ArsR family transcriptional regulator [Euryarchaeota archaeon]